MTYSVTTDYRAGMPKTSKNGLPVKLIACHDTEGGTGITGARGTISYLISVAATRSASYHEIWSYDEPLDAFNVIRIVPPTHCSHSLNPVPPPDGSYQPDPWVVHSLGDGWKDPNQGVYAVSIAGHVSDVDRYSANAKFVAHALQRIGELRAEFPAMVGLAEHFRFNPSTRTDWGKLLTPKLGGLTFTNTLPDTALAEDDVDPYKVKPPAVCKVAAGGTVYGDAERSTNLIGSYVGSDNVGIYAVPVNLPAPAGTLVPIRIEVSSKLKVGWVGWDKVSNVRVAGTTLDCTAQVLAAKADIKAKAIAAVEGI